MRAGTPVSLGYVDMVMTALGAARLGWLAASGDEADVCTAPEGGQRFRPNPAQRERLLPRYEKFRAAYPRLKDLFANRA